MFNAELTYGILDAFAGEFSQESLLWWPSDDGFTFYAVCSDTFWWGTADAEEITEDNILLLKKAKADLTGTGEEYLLPELFAAYVRKLRPMRRWTERCSIPVRKLFEAAGPERDPKDEG